VHIDFVASNEGELQLELELETGATKKALMGRNKGATNQFLILLG
jgi:hypothetical protein